MDNYGYCSQIQWPNCPIIEGDTVIQYQNPMMGGYMTNNLKEGVMKEMNRSTALHCITKRKSSYPVQKSTDQITR